MKTAENILENQNKHQRRIIFDEWDDHSPFQWIGDIESVIYRKYESARGKSIKGKWQESIRCELKFNESGKMTECERYFKGNKCSKQYFEYGKSGELNVSLVFDALGNNVMETGYNYEGGVLMGYTVDTPERTNRYIYTYDAQGKLAQKVSYNDGKINKGISYLYDEKGRILTFTEIYPKGEIGLIMSYQYDENGNIKSSLTKQDEERVITEYGYDSEGKIIRSVDLVFWVGSSRRKKPIAFIEEWEYDDYGNVFKLINRTGDQITSFSEWEIQYRK